MKWQDDLLGRVRNLGRRVHRILLKRTHGPAAAEPAANGAPPTMDEAAADAAPHTEGTPQSEAAAEAGPRENAMAAPVTADHLEKPPAVAEAPLGHEYRVIGSIGRVQRREPPAGAPPRPVVTVPSCPATDRESAFVGISHLDSLQARTPVPMAVRNMHRLGAAPLTVPAARFRAATATDTEVRGDPDLDLGDDLFSHVACVVNLKLRRSAHASANAPAAQPPEQAKEPGDAEE